MSADEVLEQRQASADLLDWMLRRMDDLIDTYAPNASFEGITLQELVNAVHACAEHEMPELVARFNGDRP